MAAGSARATTYTFSGGYVGGCSYNSNNSAYTCNSFPLTQWNDTMSIADGYTVSINTTVSFGYSQSLRMSGSAVLAVSGDLNIGDMYPPFLQVTGGTLNVNGNFVIGNQAQTISADVNAGTMHIGSGSTTRINGNVSASGNIAIASNVTINGYTNSNYGSITTGSPVTLNGDVSASNAFTLASGSTVNGDIYASTAVLQASNSTVNGGIYAPTSLELGSGVTVTGSVIASQLTLDDSSAIVYGYAVVNHATLGWAGRVVRTIYCYSGTNQGTCDCVTNNSGYPVNSANGPKCDGPQPSNPIDHFLIVHDGKASACSPEPVTIKACANASCSSYYTGGVNVTLNPGATQFSIGSSGVNSSATVSQSSVGTTTMTVGSSSVSASNALQCTNTTTNTTGSGSPACDMAFSNTVGLSMSIPDQQASTGTSTGFQLVAAVLDQNSNSCKPAFPGLTKQVQFSCNFKNPSSGTLPLRLSADNLTFNALNASNATSGVCDGSTRTYNVLFPNVATLSNSGATLYMRYGDVGVMRVNASTTSGNATVSGYDYFTVAPAAFRFTTLPTAPTTAAKAFSVSVTALNNDASPAATPNFGLETADPAIAAETVTVTVGALSTNGCTVPSASLGTISPAAVSGSAAGGATTASVSYTEAGAFNLQALQTSQYYLGSTVQRPATVQTSATSGCGAIRSLPAYFQVDEVRVGANLANFYYSGEPVDVMVTAKNAIGGVTQLYDNAYGYAYPVVLGAYDAGGTAIASSVGALTGTGASAATPILASAFAKGIASVAATAASPTVFKFAASPRAPQSVRLRATEVNGNGVSSSAGGTYNVNSEDVYEARSGRLRLATRFGTAGGDLALPLTAEYWNGANWIRNINDNDVLHPITVGTAPSGAVSIQATSPLGTPTIGPNGAGLTASRITMTQGLGNLILRPTGGIGSATVSINLGATNGDNSCLTPTRPASTGANMAYLRGPNGVCTSNTATADPAARATFGVFAPETKRNVHVREVFN